MGRYDFSKYVVMRKGKVAVDYADKPMFFDRRSDAERVCEACIVVDRENINWMK
jgi:hypothetical protein